MPTPSALPACAFREPRCTPPPRRHPAVPIVDSAHSREPPYADPGRPIPYYLTYVGMHRYAEKTSCPLPMAWNLCRDYRLGDLHYDEQHYLVRIRIHREGRGGKPFKPVLGRTRTAELGMSKADFLVRNPNPSTARQVQDPEFGAIEVLVYPGIEYELDRVNGMQVVGAVVFL